MSPQTAPTPRICSATDAVGLLGDRYAIPLVRELLYGNRRFSELASLTGAPRTLLTGRLRKLEAAGVIERRRYSERPPRDEYLLTEAGMALMPLLIGFKEWGEQYCRDGEATAVFQHRCGQEFHAMTACRACGAEVAFEDLSVVGGTHPPVIGADAARGDDLSESTTRTEQPARPVSDRPAGPDR